MLLQIIKNKINQINVINYINVIYFNKKVIKIRINLIL
jgi:hypothetical protein